MERDDQPATLPEAVQTLTGQVTALSFAVHALLLTHSDRNAARLALRTRFAEMDKYFVTGVGLQADAGMRAAYGDLRRFLLEAAGDTE